jgi:site-specific DNA-methyltransferase (adenine-specific)
MTIEQPESEAKNMTANRVPSGALLGSVVWKSACGRVTLYHADCRDVLPTLGKVDAVITDPPYGHGWAGINSTATGGRGWTKRRAEKIIGHDTPFEPAEWLALNLPTVLWGANHYADKLPASAAWLAWDKREGTAENNLSDCELAWCNVGGSARLFRHMWNGLCRASEIGDHLHPTQKPITLMAWCMDKAKVPDGATVLDPFMGSGTTGIACIRTGRRFVGVEKDPAHFATALARIQRELAQGDLFLPNKASNMNSTE